jgi:hypothetical protein
MLLYPIEKKLMKFQIGQQVILLDTEFKPAGNAVVCKYEEHIDKYEVSFIYPHKTAADHIVVSEERLIQMTNS